MKVLQIVGNSAFGGATYLVLEWCKYLVRRGCKVDVLSTDARTIAALREISEVKILNNIYLPREISLGKDVMGFINLVTLLKREKYDVVHTYTATPGFIGRIAARISGVPAIFHHQAGWTVNEYSSKLQRLVYTPIEYLGTLASTRGICVSHAVTKQAELLHIAPLNKLVTICNGIDAGPFLQATNAKGKLRSELKLPERTIIIGNVGRLSRQKDFVTFLHAGALLKQTHPELSFAIVIAGDGPCLSALESLAEELGILNLVHFLGFRSDIPALLSDFDIFVSTALWEGLSISLLEAMAAAKPIVATSILPNTELIISEQTGLLVKPMCPAQIVEAIIRYIADPELAQHCAKTSQSSVLKNYTIERMFRETWALYTSFVAQPRHI